MSKTELSELSKGVTALKKMTKTLLPSRKKSKRSKKSKAAKKSKGKKGRKTRRRKQRGGSTVSYEMPGESLTASESMLASPAPITASRGHAFYDVHGAKP